MYWPKSVALWAALPIQNADPKARQVLGSLLLSSKGAVEVSSFFRLLLPGMHIKRWLLLLLLGITFVSLGIAYLFTQAYRTQPFPYWVTTVTLQFIPRTERGLLFVAAGFAVAGVALFELSKSILAPLLSARGGNVVDILHEYRTRNRGPRIVAIGGGTGLSTLLRGLKEYSGNITAVVSVADDGGSSGVIRTEFGVLPPGDIRQCLVALADAEPVMKRLFQYRFTEGEGLKGHSFGNLFLTAMVETTRDVDTALKESSRVLAVRGEVLPSTLDLVHLSAEFDDGTRIYGESALRHAGKKISRLVLEAESHGSTDAAGEARPIMAHPDVLKAIREADLIVIGPGSLYTSVMPNLLVEEIAQAIRASRATKVYVCNVATEFGETDDFLVADHVGAIERHAGRNLFQYVLVNSNINVPLPGEFRSRLVAPNGVAKVSRGAYYTVFLADVIDKAEPRRHDSKKLAEAILKIYFDRGRQYPPPAESIEKLPVAAER